MTKIAIFASGNGSNFEAIINYFKNSTIEFTCISDNPNAYVLERAKKLNINSFIIPFEKTYDFLIENKFDLVVLAGYMRILPEKVLKLSTFINVHPSLLPEFKGQNAIKRAFESKVKETGVTIHYVSKEVDSGEIIEQKKINISPLMTFEELEKIIHKTEHSLLPQTIEKLIKKYNVLLVGSGAREHAIATKLLESKKLNKLYLYGANDGFKNLGEVLNAKNYRELAKTAKQKNIDIMISGPELPLAEGIVDIFEQEGIKCIGANKYWSQLESSKSFAKEFMTRNNIPCAKYKVITKKEEINIFPSVIKADGLAAGKGTVIVYTKEEAQKTIKEFLDGKFNEASKKIVIEEFLEGEEISLICLWDGKTLLPFECARDYKKLYNSPNAPNTGGMGSICPVKVDSEELNNYIKLLQTALIHENADFTGIIYSGLINTKEGLKVLEYNMRFGDPETQAIMMNLESDLLELFINTIEKRLDKTTIKSKKGGAICVVLASKGYPENPLKGFPISITSNIKAKIFYAGVKQENNTLLTNSGRVLSVAAQGKNAREKVYKAIENINYEGKIFRKDIGE